MSGKIIKFARQFKIRKMEKISLKIRTTKSSGEIRLRFRLLDGRRADLTHKSDISASLTDLKKFDADGSPKPKVSIYNKELAADIAKEIDVMHRAYAKMQAARLPINGEGFEKCIDSIKNPTVREEKKETLLERFNRFIDESHNEGRFADHRKSLYMVTWRMLQRYLTISGQLDILPSEVKGDDIIKFGQFIQNEFEYAEKKEWCHLYSETKKRDIPSAPRKQNTTSTSLKMLRALFNELCAGEEILRNPFMTTGRKRIQELTAQHTDIPIFLTAEEFSQLLNAKDIPDTLKETHDAFLLHCALGCRVSDFKKLTLDNVAVTSEGVSFVRYMPEKTKRQSRSNEEIQTPLMRFALDIIKRTNFKFSVLRYVSGKSGYNVKIKELLEHCEINREVPVFNPTENRNDMVPLFEVASSKLARKTLVDMLHKVQLNMYAAGLHSVGSSAVGHYTYLGISDRFTMMNIAFNQPAYKVDKELNYIK